MSLTDSPPLNAQPRVFVVCDQSDTAAIWSYIIREKGLIAVLVTSSAAKDTPGGSSGKPSTYDL